MTRDAASQRQVQAADPVASTWLSANAGSGKTRVLTDRVARLLLDGVEPQRILCLTYTKAAASEMQNRLFSRLGSWAMQDEETLRAELAGLGVEGDIGTATLQQARRLFARAIETPGGLRIQTIHSFCAALLRRFPLEAGVSPQFVEMDDRAAKLMREEIVEEMADRLAPGAVADLARVLSDEDFGDLTDEIARARAAFQRNLTLQDTLAAFGMPRNLGVDGLVAEVLPGGFPNWFADAVQVIASGSSNDVTTAAKLAALVGAEPDLATLTTLEGVLLTGKSAASPFSAKIGSFPTKATAAALGALRDPLDDLMRRVEATRPRRIAFQAAQQTAALHGFAAAFLPLYADRKAARGWLDFDDLIGKARTLLTEPSVAQWVLFRLDGGIDHILVDEAQDTSPEQWRVIELLAQEFTAGRGARDIDRTIFVVGDKKQSIYSFQGADLAAFDAMKAHFRRRLAEADTHLADLTLEHSFRSSPAILRLVDLTFDERAGRGLGGEVKHIAFNADMPGRVDLWPVIAKVGNPEPENWYDPTDLISDQHHVARLAQAIAGELAQMIRTGVQIPSRDGPRPMTAGDVLILVQRRSDLFAEIIRACKTAGLPVAGADRLKLGAELAVRDLGALLAFLATPEDDLSLAAALRSPLFGWTEGQLYTLAQGRPGYLWASLRNATESHPDTLEMLHDLRDRADFLRPYDLVERILTRHDGRRRLLARLGDEAQDGIDELLSQALAYERSDIPSLTGFLGWLDAEGVEVKRQMGAAGGRIRVMTVHGAKGLEAPIVILPETQDRKPPDRDRVISLPDGVAVWRGAADARPDAVGAVIAARQQKAAEESKRLLYVAMTRAQSWLIVAGAGETRTPDCWYNIVKDGMAATGAVALPDGTLRVATGDWPPDAAPAHSLPDVPLALPDWAVSAAPAVARAVTFSPSDLGGAKALGEGSDAALEAAAKQRGTDLHRLLEHLPGHPEQAWGGLAERLLSSDPPQPETVAARLAEARSVLMAPALSQVFGTDALTEVSITGVVEGQRMYGTIDRLLLRDDRVLAIDFKSNRLVPARPEDVPEGLLRQMGAYLCLLRQIYPDREAEVALLWTETASLMPLPPALVMAALQRTAFP